MPKATTPSPAPEPEPTDEAGPSVEVTAGPEWGNWVYTGPPGTTWTNVPLTASPGDILTWYGPPGTGWVATDAEATVRPDNWRPDPDDPGPETDPVPPAGEPT